MKVIAKRVVDATQPCQGIMSRANRFMPNVRRVVIAAIGAIGLSIVATGVSADNVDAIEEGKKIAFDRKKGNCLACHAIDDGTLAGNGGPPLIQMQARFPDKAVLREQIWDSTVKNPNSLMPPFGRHRILSEEEIDKITEYIYTL